MINETKNGQVQYDGDSSEIDQHAYDEAVKDKVEELRAEVLGTDNVCMLLEIMNLSGEDELIRPLVHFVSDAPSIVVITWLCEMEDKFEDYIEKNYNYNHITNELWR